MTYAKPVEGESSTSRTARIGSEACSPILNALIGLFLTLSVCASPPVAAVPATEGQWATPVELPTVSVNLNLLRTGKVLFWAGDFASAPNFGEIWDPATNQITPAPNPFSNIFCSANVALPDGRILVAGGHDKQNGILGLADSSAFDPVTSTWTALPKMSFRRWYPTLTALGDGRALVMSGSSFSETEFVQTPEIFNPVTNQWSQLTNATISVPQYPMMFLLPDGRLVEIGSTEYPTSTQALNIATQSWSMVDPRVLEGGSSAMYRPGRILKSGSASNDGATPNAASAATTYVIDMNEPSPAWRQTESMANPRTFHNLTTLADGTVLATSGSQRKNEIDLTPAVLPAELWSPGTETWTTMAPMQTPRIYHSTAVLLPDGRVAVSGSGNIGGATNMTSVEVFSPPYLFKGARPTITSAPSQVQYGTTFTVQTPNAADITAVNLVRPGSATHNFDMNQRFVPLTFTRVGGALEVQATANPNVAPPGYYMLFLINSAGVPSVASFMRFPTPSEDSQPPTAPVNLTASGGISKVDLTWAAASDNIGIRNYSVHRSTTPGFTPSVANRVGQPSGTSYTDAGLAAGTYHYLVTAVDAAGNTGPASNPSAAAVAADTIPPSVAMSSPNSGSTLSGAVTVAATATDNGVVAGVQFKLDGVALGAEDTSAPYSYAWNTLAATNGAHVLTAVARDAANNTTESLPVNVTVSNTQQAPAGLVAAYGFDEGSGSSAADASGNGNTGTVSGASWVAQGRSGAALSFNGTNSLVTVAHSNSLDLTTGMTLSAWVNPTVLSGYRTVLLKEVSGELSYALYANNNEARPSGYGRYGSTSVAVPGTSTLPTNTWSHLAVTYDGANLRLYVNGTQVGSVARTGSLTTSTLPLRIGGNSVWTDEYFSGLIDEVRVYNRALSPTELQGVMNLPVSSVVTAPKVTITSPANNSSVAGSSLNVAYSTSGSLTEAREVHFQLDGGTPLRDTTIDGQFTLTSLSPGAHTLAGYLVRLDQTKIAGSDAASVVFNVTAPDTIRPTVVITAPRDGDTLSGSRTLTATATDNGVVAGVRFKLDGVAVGTEDTSAPYSYTWNTATATNGVHVLTAVARDTANNSAESLAVNVIVSNTQVAPAGLVAAYGFDEGSGSSAADASGNGNTGTVSGASWVAQGRIGGALSFNGTNSMVTVADSNSLDLTTGMTLAAWVRPTALGGYRTVLLKEVSGELSYALYASNDNARPSGYGRYGSTSVGVAGTSTLPTNTWSHLALTYDGSNLRLYVNGTQVGSVARTGTLATSTLPLRIGGNSVWGEYFSGLIDEVRVYNRALNPTQIQGIMSAAATRQAPTRSSPISLDSRGRRVWVANPDNNSVSAINADSLALQFEVPVGKHPSSVAVDGSGQVWVACRDDDSVWVLGATDGVVRRVLNLPWGSAPIGVVLSPNGANGFLALKGSGLVQRFVTATQTLGPAIAVGSTPTALAVTSDGRRLLVSQFISSENKGTVRTVQLDTFATGPTLSLPLDTTSQDGSLAARGIPNYLSGLAIDPSNSSAWVVGEKDNILRGSYRDGQALTFETTVRSMLSPLDLISNQEVTSRRVDLDNLSQPSAIALSDSGAQLFVTMQGNNQLLVLNQLGREITRATTGLAPQGVVIDSVTNRIFTQDFMGRTVSVFDGTGVLRQTGSVLPRLAQVRTIGTEKLAPGVLRGKQIFYNAADTRMGRDGYISCASCHLDGDQDGQVWDFTDRGEGLRNTISLEGKGGRATAPFHWTGNFDEVQDFENDIRGAFGGSGFMTDADFSAGTRRQPLGDPKAGLSPELDDLAAYVGSLAETGRSPRRDASGALTSNAQAGKILFENLGCQICHGSERFNDPSPGSRHDVGTIKAGSGQRLGAALDGFDTPPLVGLWSTAPYLHDGSAKTIRDVLTTANPNGRHGDVTGLSSGQIDQLSEYLMQLEHRQP